MSAIDKIIYNLIATHRSVNLPQAGSLNVERHGAAFDGRRNLVPPRCRVVYSRNPKPGNCDILQEIGRIGAVDESRAAQLYESWLHRARTADPENDLTIEEVGTLRLDFFTLSPELEALLNPDGKGRIALSPRRSPAPWLWSLAAAGAAVAVWLAVTRTDALRPSASEEFIAEQLKSSVRDHVRQQTAPQDEHAGETAWNSADETAGEPAGESAEDFILRELQQQAAQSAAPEQTAGNLAGESPAAEAPSGSESPAAEVPSGSEAPTAPVAPQSEATHIHYVVAAVFSSEENAERYIAQNRGTVEGAHFEKVFYAPGRWVVSAYSSEDREQAEEHARALRKWNEGVWIYSKKIR